MMRRVVLLGAALLGVFAVAASAAAQQYPGRPVTIIVPYPAGGPVDETARVVAQSLSDKLKQSFIVEDVSGGNTIIGMEKVARAAPDGYTLLLHNLQISANVSLFKTLPFDTLKDFTSVMLINRNPLVLVGRTTLAPATLKDLVALMKTERLKAAIPGFGATGHLATALFAQEAGAKVDLIPYRGAAPALTDLMGGHVDLFFGTPQQLVQQVATGKVKGFGVTSRDRLPDLPDMESLVSSLGPKLDIVYWQALYAPAGTPEAVIRTLNKALQETVSDPAIVKTWAAQDVSPFPERDRTPTAGAAFLRSEIDRWGEVIRANDIHVEQ
ncbi:MAG: tripartite tricarboxylate transporter substrate-binding protein [Xanthobacteraceae bacterium]